MTAAERFEGPSHKQLRILDAAADAFMELGYNAASIDNVADRMGVTKGKIYYYYRSKMDLFFAVHRCAMVSNLERIRPLATDSGVPVETRLHAMVTAHALQMMEQTRYQQVTVQGVEMYQSASTTAAQRQQLEALVAMRAEYEDMFFSNITEGMEGGRMRSGADPRLATRTLLGALNWITMWYRPRATDTSVERDRTARQVANQLMFGLIPGPSTTGRRDD